MRLVSRRDEGDEASISPGCAAALAEEALAWLQSGQLTPLLHALKQESSSATQSLALLAAMLGFLAVHMGHQDHQVRCLH